MANLKTAAEKVTIRIEMATKRRNKWWDSRFRGLKTEAGKRLRRWKKKKGTKDEYCDYSKRCEERKEKIWREGEKNKSHTIRATKGRTKTR